MFYHWICWQAECVNIGVGTDIDMVSFLLRLKFWRMLKAKNTLFGDEAFLFIRGKEVNDGVRNVNKRTI